MKQVDCYLCGSDSKLELFIQKGRDAYLELISKNLLDVPRYWYVCSKCGFVFRSPVLEENELNRLYECYEKNVFKGTTPDEYFDKIVSLPSSRSENKQKVLWLKQVLIELGLEEKSFGHMSVLDVGCGGGTLLYSIAKQLGLKKLFGVELNETYADLAARRTPAKILNAEYSRGMFNRKFQLIICTKVLEHISDPLVFLSELSGDLTEDGYLFLEVPDISDLYSLPQDHERFSIPHVYYFSLNTLKELFGRAGLAILKSRTIKSFKNRSYLQIVAKQSKYQGSVPKPYDDSERLMNLVKSSKKNFA